MKNKKRYDYICNQTKHNMNPKRFFKGNKIFERKITLI